jgi:hypothetical protein
MLEEHVREVEKGRVISTLTLKERLSGKILSKMEQ